MLEVGRGRVLRGLGLGVAIGALATGRERQRGEEAQAERPPSGSACDTRRHWSAFSAAVIQSLMKENFRLRSEKRSEISSTPTPTSTTPDVISRARKCRRMREKPSRKTSMLQPAIRNGTASPAE